MREYEGKARFMVTRGGVPIGAAAPHIAVFMVVAVAQGTGSREEQLRSVELADKWHSALIRPEIDVLEGIGTCSSISPWWTLFTRKAYTITENCLNMRPKKATHESKIVVKTA